MKASDLFVTCLENEGIRYVFGVPGEENADFMMSLERSERIEFVLCRHEQGAAFISTPTTTRTSRSSAIWRIPSGCSTSVSTRPAG